MRTLLNVFLVSFFLHPIWAESFFTAEAEYGAGPEPGTYAMKVTIKKVSIEGDEENSEIIAAPAITAKIGQEAKIEIVGGANGRDILVSSYYPSEGNTPPITCSVEVKDGGKTVFRTKIQVRINELESGRVNINELIKMARGFIDTGDLDRARKILQAIVLVEPTNRSAKYYLDICERSIAKRADPEPQPQIIFP